MSKRLQPVPVRRGRPRKFGRPSRVVTLTLPEDVIGTLSSIDEDLGRAVVRVTLPLARRAPAKPAAELTKYGQSAVIVVTKTPALERIPGVTLVPMPDGLSLISIDDSMTLSDFELRLRDLIEEGTRLEPRDKSTLVSIAAILTKARRTRGVHLEQRSIIVLQSSSHRLGAVG